MDLTRKSICSGLNRSCGGIARSLLSLMALVVGTIHTGKIIPDKTRPITMSSTNALNKAEYNFTMKLESNTIPGCTIQIQFPDQQYIDGLGLDYSFVAYSPYGSVIPSSVSGKVLSLQPGYRDNYTDIVLTVQGIQNPAKVGGTGMFKVYYTCGTSVIDLCENFGSIAVTQPVSTLFQSYLMVEPGSSNVAGELSNYLIYIAPTNDISENANFRVTFPLDYNFTYLSNLVSDFPSSNPCQVAADNTTGFKPSGNFSCKFSTVYGNVIEWQGNNASIPKKSPIWLKLQNVYNPAREMVTDFLTVEIILKNTNFTYEYDDSVTGLLISPGPIMNFLVNPVLQLPLEQSKTYDFFITFTPTNSFQSLRIATRFSTISSCVVKSGLLPLTSNSLINCNINSNVIEISGIQKYTRKYQINADKVTIKLLNAKTPAQSGKLIPFELYTYQNGDFTTKVDQDVTSTGTVIFITTSRRFHPDFSASSDSDNRDLHFRIACIGQYHDLQHSAFGGLRPSSCPHDPQSRFPSAFLVWSELASAIELPM